MTKPILPALALLLIATGCTEAQREDAYRTGAVTACKAEAEGGFAPADVVDELCECAVDKVIEKFGLIDDISQAQIGEVLGDCIEESRVNAAG